MSSTLSPIVSLWTVTDGHGRLGHTVAEQCARDINAHLLRNLRGGTISELDGALKSAYVAADEKLAKQIQDDENSTKAKSDMKHSGACACTVVVTEGCLSIGAPTTLTRVLNAPTAARYALRIPSYTMCLISAASGRPLVRPQTILNRDSYAPHFQRLGVAIITCAGSCSC